MAMQSCNRIQHGELKTQRSDDATIKRQEQTEMLSRLLGDLPVDGVATYGSQELSRLPSTTQLRDGVHAFRALWPTRVWRYQVVRAIVYNKLAVVLAAVLDGERPDGGVVGPPVPEKFRCYCPALLLNHFRSVRDSLLHELHHVGLGLENTTGRIVALAEVGPEF
jgi:hypothetical protein